MNYLSQKIVALVMALSVYSIAQAQSNSQPTSSTTQNTAIHNSQSVDSTRKAQQWNLQPDEWQRYQEIMGGPLGIYSPNLDPLTALGISARSDEERRRYAELQVQAEIQRVERELAYQRAYDEAFKRLYPNLLPIDFGTSSQPIMSAMPSSNGRMAVFVRDNCASCDTKVQELQTQGSVFDIYMVGSQDDDTAIRRWATKAGIDPKKVFSRAITLNHDAGRWQSLGMSGDLPAVIVEVNGRLVRK